jgi:2-keto-4-pentenoate hydratase
MERRGEPVAAGAGIACYGNPLAATLWLARKMYGVGRPLRKGDTILSGSLGPLVTIAPNDSIELRISGLGAVRCHFSD